MRWRSPSYLPRHLNERTQTPKVAFLFLTTGQVVHQRLWEKWFEGHGGSYSLYVHVTPSGIDEEFRDLNSFFRAAVIPSVRTEYFKNVLHGMIQLILYAYADNSNKHFVFLAPDSIPVKPFSYVYKTLAFDGLSRFCFSPWSQTKVAWEEYAKSPANQSLLPHLRHQLKGELWSSISRAHVATLLANMRRLLDLGKNYGRFVSHGGAADEVILPTLLHELAGSEAFRRCHGQYSTALKHQSGCCPTYTFWNDYLEEAPQVALVPNFSKIPGGDGRPFQFTKLPRPAFAELVHEPGFLFLRKVQPDAFVLESDRRIPLAEAIRKIFDDHAP